LFIELREKTEKIEEKQRKQAHKKTEVKQQKTENRAKMNLSKVGARLR
jgi:hypothetical protein